MNGIPSFYGSAIVKYSHFSLESHTHARNRQFRSQTNEKSKNFQIDRLSTYRTRARVIMEFCHSTRMPSRMSLCSQKMAQNLVFLRSKRLRVVFCLKRKLLIMWSMIPLSLSVSTQRRGDTIRGKTHVFTSIVPLHSLCNRSRSRRRGRRSADKSYDGNLFNSISWVHVLNNGSFRLPILCRI